MGRWLVHGWLVLAGTLVVVLASAWGAGAVTVEDLTGEMSFETLKTTGDAQAETSQLGALYATTEDGQRVNASWSVEVDEAVVNWTHLVVQGAGLSPGEPGESLVEATTSNRSDEVAFQDVALRSRIDAKDTDVLVVPDEDADVSMATQASDGWTVQPAEQDTWQAGETTNDTQVNDGIFLFEQHETGPGSPLAQAPGSVTATVVGSFTVYVWGPEITVNGDEGEHTYRSGHWVENETRDPVAGERVQGEDHYQLLRLYLTGARLVWEQSAGPLQWTGQQVHAHTQGPAHYAVREGALVADDHQFALEDDRVSLRGEVSHELAAGVDEGVLQSHVEAERAEVGAAPLVGAADGEGGAWSWLAALVIGAVVGAAVVGSRSGDRVRARARAQDGEDAQDPQDAEEAGPSLAQIRVQAEQALNEHRPARARKAAQTLLEAEVDVFGAWSIMAASYLQEARPELVVEEVAHHLDADDVEEASDPSARASLAYLLAYAHIQVGEVQAAWPWVEIAAEVEWVREKLRWDPVFAILRETDRFARIVGDGEPEGDLGPAYH